MAGENRSKAILSSKLRLKLKLKMSLAIRDIRECCFKTSFESFCFYRNFITSLLFNFLNIY